MSSTRGKDPSYVDTPEGPALEIPVRAFLHKVLPTLPPEVELDKLIENKLRGGTRSAPITTHGRLWGYAKKNPSGLHRSDVRKAYAHLETGAQAFIRAVEGRESTLVFRNNPKPIPYRSGRELLNLPDAYMLRASTSVESVEWEDIAVIGEYKRSCDERDVEEVCCLR